MRKELLKRPHILICSAEFLSSEEVNPGHLLQATSVGMGIDLCASGYRERTSQFDLLRQGTYCSTVASRHLGVTWAGKFAGRANSGLEVTPTSEHRRRSQNLGRRSPWGRRRRDGRIVLDLIHLAFRRLANWHLGC